MAWPDWRWWMRTTGKALIVAGMLLIGFVGYQLWGTGIEHHRSQNALEHEFEDLLAATTTTAPAAATTEPPGPAPTPTAATSTTTPTTPTATTATISTISTVPAAPSTTAEGDPVARLEIPAIGVDQIVVEGVSVEALRRGPGHYPATPLPGTLGNAAIAGHRTTYGQPFFDVDDLEAGDEIVVTTVAGRYVYAVTGTEIVGDDDVHVVATTDPTIAELTLTSCEPKWSARRRIIVRSRLVGDRSDPVAASPADTAATTTTTTSSTTTLTTSVPGTDPDASGPVGTPATAPAAAGGAGDPDGTAAVPEPVADAFSEGWFHDRGAIPHMVAWGGVLAAVAIGARLLGRRIRPGLTGTAAAFAIGALPFLVALYFFYQNVNRLLPPSL